ncbi:DegT/DnrJ/EryC1/StrS family aminotransferase, partial [Desulfovibrio desulfuricans]|nr:DegT/DnrJ/EryC1/StrS family aminotransferase [Desulfovibrio desulfuricans]
MQGLVDKYTWHDVGSSFLPSDILAAILSAQMDRYDEIMEKRMNVWNIYYNGLKELEDQGVLRRPVL